MTERPPFPTVLDSTLLAQFRACPQHALMESLLHWKHREPNVHLHAGAAYASGLEAARNAFYQDGRHPDDAIALGLGALLKHYGDFSCPPDSPKSAERMAGALEYYFHQFPLGADAARPIHLPSGKHGIEFSFSEPIDVLHPETGDPLLYCGRMDMIVDYNGMILGEDDKTTSRLGGSWGDQWQLRSQFSAYTWGAQRAGIPIKGFLIRGIAILKSGYSSAEIITYRPPWQVDRWYRQTVRDAARMVEAWKSGVWDYNLDESCVTKYGRCPFHSVCQMSDPTPQLALNFERRRWDPVTRTETLLEK